jgi:hypothetical protein
LLLKRLAGCLDRGLAVSHDALEQVGLYARDLQAVDGLLRPSDATTGEEREARFISLQQAWQSSTDPVEQHFAKIMSSFELGLFVGGEAADLPTDNLDLERWFKGPKGHERRIHGHRHAGVRIVWQGPTLMLALDAHMHHDGPFTVEDLEPYGRARVPESQQQAVERGKIMRQARSRKKRPVLLADLEKRYLNAP